MKILALFLLFAIVSCTNSTGPIICSDDSQVIDSLKYELEIKNQRIACLEYKILLYKEFLEGHRVRWPNALGVDTLCCIQ